MAPTIHVHEELLLELDMLRKQMSMKSHDEVIKMLLKNVKKLRRTHFGTLPELKTFRRNEVDRLG